MKKSILLFVFSFLSFVAYAQDKFEKGYFIDNDGNKTTCFIQNTLWKNNPKKFTYKLDENSNSQTGTLDQVQEFAITGILKYKRFTVQIDRAYNGTSLARLSKVIEPTFTEETLFLKTLVDGAASLYSYEESNLNRFFYQVDEQTVEQLIYKKYLKSGTKVGQNTAYIHQLWENVKCQEVAFSDLQNLAYRKDDLVSYFTNYNTCKKADFTTYSDQQIGQGELRLAVKPGLIFSSLAIEGNSGLATSRDVDFGNKLNFRLGVELEYRLPYKNKQVAIFLEPTYQSFSGEKVIALDPRDVLNPSTNVTIDYTAIEVPLGIRYYFNLKGRSKLFLDGAFVSSFVTKGTIAYEANDDFNLEAAFSTNLAFGVGYNYNDQFSIEARYGLNRDILTQHAGWRSEYNTVSIILGYTFLSPKK